MRDEIARFYHVPKTKIKVVDNDPHTSLEDLSYLKLLEETRNGG